MRQERHADIANTHGHIDVVKQLLEKEASIITGVLLLITTERWIIKNTCIISYIMYLTVVNYMEASELCDQLYQQGSCSVST